MKKFCFQVVAFLGLQALLFAGLLCRYDVSAETNYLAATVDKQARLRAASPPRLILVGGSNLPFGIRSDRLEEALGRPVVNMGLVAGLGLDFMLNEVAGCVRRGDIVLLSLEYDRFSGGYNPLTLRQIVEYRPASIRFLTLGQAKRVVLGHGLALIGGIARRGLRLGSGEPTREAEAGIYVRGGFNRWGDLVSHYGKPPPRTQAIVEAPRDGEARDWLPSPAVLERLRSFGALCERRGAHFVFSFPPHPIESLRGRAQALEKLTAELAGIPGLTLIDTAATHGYAASFFYDTGYHLTEAGATLRTERLVGALRAFLRQNQHPPRP